MDRINIIEPNGVERTRPLPLSGLRIGRGSENDIVLGYDDVSRHHTEIGFNGEVYYVIDLGSANGTLMGNSKLPPNTPTQWHPNMPLTIGRVVVRLQVSQRSTASMPSQSNQESETIVGFLPEADDPGRRINMLLILGMIALILFCIAAGVVGVFFF
jgi:pSer/pThr/pTyr-binding forkhead associated (FHA) protein